MNKQDKKDGIKNAIRAIKAGKKESKVAFCTRIPKKLSAELKLIQEKEKITQAQLLETIARLYHHE